MKIYFSKQQAYCYKTEYRIHLLLGYLHPYPHEPRCTLYSVMSTKIKYDNDKMIK